MHISAIARGGGRRIVREPDGTAHEYDLRTRSPEFEARVREQLGELYEPVTEHVKMSMALQKLIDDPGISSVDKLLIGAVGNWPEGLRYLGEQIRLGISSVAPDVGAQARAQVGAAAGTFGFTIGSAGPGVGALAVYFFETQAALCG